MRQHGLQVVVAAVVGAEVCGRMSQRRQRGLIMDGKGARGDQRTPRWRSALWDNDILQALENRKKGGDLIFNVYRW